VSETKERILQSAEELISEQGVARTTIAMIAKKASVSDSLAYQYFKDKEDLVFAVARRRLEDALNQLQDHLQGIYDARSQLGKLLWFGLSYNDGHRDYVRNLMFEYRSNRDFYRSEAYGFIRRHAGITLGILTRGVEEKVFTDKADMRLVREILYGALDFEAVDSVITGEIQNAASDWNDLMDLTLRMIEAGEPTEPVEKRDRIIECAEKIFADSGFAKARIADVAGMAGIAEGSIYDFFEHKEDLLFSITEKRLNELLDPPRTMFVIQSPSGKLQRFIESCFERFLRNRDFLKVFVMDNLLSRRFYSSKAYGAFTGHMRVLEDIIEAGKASGAFRPEVNARVFRNMFLGAFTHIALRWIVFGERHFDKMNEIDHLTKLLCRAVTPHK
jgi:TetR/AcrR family fatty acid metabolism transcriptional regulator